ncbi:fimbrial chaperone protein [Natronospira proteinivora]|uniref:Fimbrial chaperone protein n=1 Tax=Natronospira proteinivora TaxID=1807133 RepID=A0ABT1G7F0_9GAMM|nr:fimbria/pilus periplasmic chaperone [Natronospira proteinivora]MCP1727234.1 fimbrial chaperone protein [Natronospira proteinivora]
MFRLHDKAARLMGVGLLLFLFAGIAGAQSVSISPTIITLGEDREIGTFTLSNSGDRETTIHARVYRWDQDDGQDRLTESQDLLLAPPIFALGPGESQVVRTGLRRSLPGAQEASYRVEFQEVLPDARTGPEMGLRLALQISVPVFIGPLEPGSADLSWTVHYDRSAGEAVIAVENQGYAHARLTRMALVHQDDDRILAQPGRQLNYVLPGAAREWRMPVDRQQARHAVLEVRGRAGSDDINVSLDLE